MKVGEEVDFFSGRKLHYDKNRKTSAIRISRRNFVAPDANSANYTDSRQLNICFEYEENSTYFPSFIMEGLVVLLIKRICVNLRNPREFASNFDEVEVQ